MAPDQSDDPDGEYRIFRPTAVRIVAVVVPVVFGASVIGIVSTLQAGVLDWVGFGGLIVLLAWLMYRLGGCYAKPSPKGLVVRNVFIMTTLEWPEIVNVRFGEEPWPHLDLANGDVLAVMGIQRADGPRSQAEAVRLANLVERHGTANHP